MCEVSAVRFSSDESLTSRWDIIQHVLRLKSNHRIVDIFDADPGLYLTVKGVYLSSKCTIG